MTAIRACEDHGYFEGEGDGEVEDHGCPVCSDAGELALDGTRRRRLSKFTSGALRHFPGDVGLSLDGAGWTPFEDLVAAVERKYDWATREHVAAVVATDPKGRFERAGPASDDADADADAGRDGGRVRAAYGHSVAVALGDTDDPVPDALYHGTAPENVPSIRADGLEPMSRQQVHLSGTVAAAREVGRRHAADPVVFVVDAAAMRGDGHRITRRGEGVYTTDAVPPRYLSVRSADR